MSERVIATIKCSTCEGKRPTMAELIETPAGVVFRPKPYQAATVEVHYSEGSGVQSARARRRRYRDSEASVNDESARLRCGCPRGHGTVTLDREMITKAVDAYRQFGHQTINIIITPKVALYRVEPD